MGYPYDLSNITLSNCAPAWYCMQRITVNVTPVTIIAKLSATACVSVPALKASRVKMRGKRSNSNTPADENEVTVLKVKADFT